MYIKFKTKKNTRIGSKMKKITKILMLSIAFVCISVTLSGCLSTYEMRRGVMLGDLRAESNNVLLKVETCENCTFSSPETPDGCSYVIVKFSVVNNSNVDLPLNIDENFTAKFEGESIVEAEEISKKYRLDPITSITKNTTKEFEVGYLLPATWFQIEIKYNPDQNTTLNVIVAIHQMDIVVQSNDMEPTFSAGDTIRVRINNTHEVLFEEGTIILFYDENCNICIRRVVDMDFDDQNFYYITKADANIHNDADLVCAEDIFAYLIGR